MNATNTLVVDNGTGVSETTHMLYSTKSKNAFLAVSLLVVCKVWLCRLQLP